MQKLKTNLLVGFLWTSIAGTLFHFVYDWTGQNPWIGLFFPINESTFEHMKLIFFPSLLYLPIVYYYLQQSYPDLVRTLCQNILFSTWLLPVLFYTYTGIIGKIYAPVDISLFFICVGLLFWRSYKNANKKTDSIYPYLVFAMAILFLACTYTHPAIGLFANPVE